MMQKVRREYSNGRLQANTVKIWADGILESYTAKMLEPYSDKPEDTGLLMVPRKEIMAAVPLLDKAGFQVHIHAIGDATVRYALDAFEKAQKSNGKRDSRHLTAHTQVVNPSDVGRFVQLDVIAGFTPYWTYADSYISDINPPQLGEERMQQMYPIRSILESGGRVAFGSDWSVSTADPLLGIEAAVTHIEPDGEPTPVFIPSERITLDQAIAGYTIDVAYANFLEEETGSIEVGKFADLVVLSDNLFDLAPVDISEVTVVATLLEGEIIYGDL
jgi:predicted amidohydrolase YtcJ